VNDQWIPGPPSKPPTWTDNPLPPSNAWDQTEGCAAESGPAIVEGITITGVPATVSSLYWQVSLNDGGSPPNFQINALDGAGNFVSTAAEISPTTINLDYPVLLSRDPVEPMEAVTLEYLQAHAEFPEAPMDNYSYARYMATWERLPQSYIPEAPNTSQRFGRFNSTWQLDAIQTDAAADGNAYGRLNNAWTPVIPTTGGTITGSLTVNQVMTVQGPNSLVLNAPLNNPRAILAQAAGITRWLLNLGDQTNEGLNNVGANFSLQAYSTTGVSLGTWLTIARADGSTIFNGSGVTINGGLAVNGLLAVNSLGNFYLPGGSAGQFLSTNGSGLLSWATPAGGGSGGPPVTISATPPLAPAVGALWWDSVGGQLYIWYSDPNTSQWVIAVNAASQGSGGATVAIGDAPPANPQVGALWWDSVHGQFYLFFNDGNSTQWVPTTNQMGGGYLPLTGGSLSGALNVVSQIEVDGVGASPIIGLPGGGGAVLRLNKGASGGNAVINSYTNASTRWQLYLGNSAAESGGNAGSDFQIASYADNGTNLASPLWIYRATGAVAIQGTNTNDSAVAGFVGEVVQSVVTTPVTLPTGTANNVASISLTPGDWDVMAELWIALPGAGLTLAQGAITATSATMPLAIAANVARTSLNAPMNASGTTSFPLGPVRAQNATTTTYYLVALATYTTGTCTATGKIWARRAR
jgi:hypothetical protein